MATCYWNTDCRSCRNPELIVLERKRRSSSVTMHHTFSCIFNFQFQTAESSAATLSSTDVQEALSCLLHNRGFSYKRKNKNLQLALKLKNLCPFLLCRHEIRRSDSRSPAKLSALSFKISAIIYKVVVRRAPEDEYNSDVGCKYFVFLI